jgi:hypothetical protein
LRIDLLQSGLPVTESPGLDTTDPRFDEIATLVQDGRYIEAANQCETIIAEGVYDIRLICYFLYGYWLEQGLASLVSVIDCLNYVLLENWQAIGPIKRREQVVQNSLAWIFRQILKTIQHEEKKNTPQWQEWQSSFSAEDAEKILEASEAFRLSVNQQLESSVDSLPDYGKVMNWFRQLQKIVYIPPEPEPEQPTTAEDIAPAKQENNTAVATIPKSEELSIELSYPMALLLKKLAAFEHLVQDENFSRAALLADDINQSLASFDPLIYFPKTFETFVRLQALKYEELSPYESYQGSPQWQAMQHWLKTDIDSFMNN